MKHVEWNPLGWGWDYKAVVYALAQKECQLVLVVVKKWVGMCRAGKARVYT